jgi:hypothetical protein
MIHQSVPLETSLHRADAARTVVVVVLADLTDVEKFTLLADVLLMYKTRPVLVDADGRVMVADPLPYSVKIFTSPDATL